MNKKQTYSLMNQGILTMAFDNFFRKIILSFLLCTFFYTSAISNVVYDKKGIIITEVELTKFKELLFQNQNKKLNDKEAIKEIVLLKKTLINLNNKNPIFIDNIDKMIISQYGQNNFDSTITRDYLRYLKIRNDFIIDYFNNDLKIEDIETVINKFSEFNMPISNNGCNTILKIIDLKNDNNFVLNFYENLLEKKRAFKTKLENNIFDVCISNEDFKIIENQLINHIEIKTEDSFRNFIYGK